MYHITQYTKNQAKLLGVDVKPSKNKSKKIDVIRNGDVIASVGAIGYADYPTYIKTKLVNKKKSIHQSQENQNLQLTFLNSSLSTFKTYKHPLWL